MLRQSVKRHTIVEWIPTHGAAGNALLHGVEIIGQAFDGCPEVKETSGMTDRAGFPISPGALSAAKIRLCVGKDDPIIVEVGANNGQTTVEILRAMPRATIYAFEPDPRAIAKFRAAVTHPNVHLYECAIGAIS